MSTESLLWVPAVAMLLFTVTYICFILIYIHLSRLLLEGRTKMVSANVFFFFFFFFQTTFEVLLKLLSRGGDGIICICQLHRLEASILVFMPPKNFPPLIKIPGISANIHKKFYALAYPQNITKVYL